MLANIFVCLVHLKVMPGAVEEYLGSELVVFT